MRFLVDENIGTSVVAFLQGKRHDVSWIRKLSPGMDDAVILALALKQKRVLLTYDQDFGELIFLQQKKHYGVLLLRLSVDNVMYHVQALEKFLSRHTAREIKGQFWKIGDEYL